MVTGYFDEAGGRDQGFMVVAGWAATVEQWERFQIDWRLVLAKHNVPYLHMKELSAFDGPYRKWKDAPGPRANFLRDAAEVVSDHVQVGCVSFTAYETFYKIDKIYGLASKFSSPYALTGRTCVLLANRWRAKLDFEYVFDDGGPDKQGLLNAMGVVLPYLPDPIFRPSRDMKPCRKWPTGRKGVIQLQAADYLAYEIRKFIADHPKLKTGERQFRRSLGALPGYKVQRVFIDEQKLVNLCEQLGLNRSS